MFHWLHKARAKCVQLRNTSLSGTFSLYQRPLPGASWGVSRPHTMATMRLWRAAACAKSSSDSTYFLPWSEASISASK